MILHEENGKLQLARLEVAGPPVGLLPHSKYQTAQAGLGDGDLIVLFTDGISEAMNMQDEEWGEERLIEAIKNSDGLPPEAIVETVFRLADEFTGEAPQHDDMIIVVLAVDARKRVSHSSVQDLAAK